jgi:ADP-ribose pyrophosphatase YjhB (NUDIX family)
MPPRFPVAVHLFLLRGERVLLLRRANTGFADGMWSVPAGHVERGETVVAAAVREAREEVGLVLEPASVRVVGVMHRRGAEEERVDFFLACDLGGGVEPRNAEPHKCSELAWADPRSVPPDLVPYVRAGLESLTTGRWYQEHGWGDDSRTEGSSATT